MSTWITLAAPLPCSIELRRPYSAHTLKIAGQLLAVEVWDGSGKMGMALVLAPDNPDLPTPRQTVWTCFAGSVEVDLLAEP